MRHKIIKYLVNKKYNITYLSSQYSHLYESIDKRYNYRLKFKFIIQIYKLLKYNKLPDSFKRDYNIFKLIYCIDLNNIELFTYISYDSELYECEKVQHLWCYNDDFAMYYLLNYADEYVINKYKYRSFNYIINGIMDLIDKIYNTNRISLYKKFKEYLSYKSKYDNPFKNTNVDIISYTRDYIIINHINDKNLIYDYVISN